MADSTESKESGKGSKEGGATHTSKDPINLRKMFPLAYRSILKRSIHWIAGFALLMILISLVDRINPHDETMASQIYFLFCLTLLLLGVVLLCCKLLYEVVYHHIYYYGIELEHLVISRGIFFKTRASFPLSSMTDLYLHRDPIDLLFLLYNLNVTTPSPVAEHGSIEGLSTKKGAALQNYLLALVNTTTTPTDEDAATDTLRSLKASEDPPILGPSPAEVDPPRMKAEDFPVLPNGDSVEKSSDENGDSSVDKRESRGERSEKPERRSEGRRSSRRNEENSRESDRDGDSSSRYDDRDGQHTNGSSSKNSSQHSSSHYRDDGDNLDGSRNKQHVDFFPPVAEKEPKQHERKDSFNGESKPFSAQTELDTEEVLEELERTQVQLEKTRDELQQTEVVLEKAKEALESSRSE